MEAHGFGYEEIGTTFANYYCKANQDGHWLPTKTARNSHGALRNFANQAKLELNKGKTFNKSKSTCHNCGETGHWANDCPNNSSKNQLSNLLKKKGSAKGGTFSDKGISWTKVPPRLAQPQTKTMHDKKFHWCATCKCWTQSHGTAEHKSKASTNTTTIAPTGNKPSTNISLMATSTNFAAWHVSISNEKEDFLGKKMIAKFH
jgi:hypothetical protein